jgi:hypothetical protein
MYNADAAEEWLDSWAAQAGERAEAAARLTRQVAAVTATAHNHDRTITVTVGSTGQIEALDLEDRALHVTGRELSRDILAVTRDAQAKLTRLVAAEVERTVGADTETGRAVVDAFDRRFPAPAEENDR